MNDREFENMLIDEVSGMTPENDIIKSITPWKKYMRLLVLGMCFSLVRIEFFGEFFSVVLLFGGHIMLLLGYSGLRKENTGFMVGYISEIIRFLIFMIDSIASASIWKNYLVESTTWKSALVVNSIVTLVLCISLCIGIRAVEVKVQAVKKSRSPVVLIWWYLFINFFSGILGISGLEEIYAIVMIVIYYAIFICLRKVYVSLDKIGYAIKPATIRISNKVIVVCVVFVTIVALVIVYSKNSYPMEWKEYEQTQSAELDRVKENLIRLGMPEYIISDMTEEDLHECADAKYMVMEEENNDSMDIVRIGLCLDEKRTNWKIIDYFSWNEHPDVYGVEAVRVTGANAYLRDNDFSGQLLCEKDGKTYTSDYYDMNGEEYLTEIFGYWLEGGSLLASFSFDSGSENQRGYISYAIMPESEDYQVDLYVEYYYHKSVYMYPVEPVKQEIPVFSFAYAVYYDSEYYGLYKQWMEFVPVEVE